MVLRDETYRERIERSERDIALLKAVIHGQNGDEGLLKRFRSNEKDVADLKGDKKALLLAFVVVGCICSIAGWALHTWMSWPAK
jgi:hypothetical protein